MNTLLEYLNFRGDLSFFKSPFNENDALLLSCLIGLDYKDILTDDMTIAQAAFKYKNVALSDTNDDRISDKESLLFLMGSAKRFMNVKLCDYVRDISSENEMTFYALTFKISPFTECIVYRGTDGSLLSWKENFSTLYTMPTKGQLQAKEYLTKHLKSSIKRYFVIGHSKGGNLALYASCFQDVKHSKRIRKVFSLDAPGFLTDITCASGYSILRNRINFYVPQYCVVGELLNPPFDRKIVVSSGSGVFQHDVFSWELESTGPLLTDNVTTDSQILSEKINNWAYSIPLDERKAVVEELFSVFTKNGIYHISQLLHLDWKHTVGLIMSATRLSSETKEFLSIVFKEIKR